MTGTVTRVRKSMGVDFFLSREKIEGESRMRAGLRPQAVHSSIQWT